VHISESNFVYFFTDPGHAPFFINYTEYSLQGTGKLGAHTQRQTRSPMRDNLSLTNTVHKQIQTAVRMASAYRLLNTITK